MKQIYFDHNATTPLLDEVFEAMTPYLKEAWGNPSSIHWAGRGARGGLDTAREQVAEFFGCATSEIIFTSSGEEGISLSYLEQLFVKLRRGHLVKSIRGPGGGYILERDSSEISVGEVITVVEEALNPVACLDADAAVCDKSNVCITQRVWKGLGDKIKEFLNSITIEDLKNEASALHHNTGIAKAHDHDLCTPE